MSYLTKCFLGVAVLTLLSCDISLDNLDDPSINAPLATGDEQASCARVNVNLCEEYIAFSSGALLRKEVECGFYGESTWQKGACNRAGSLAMCEFYYSGKPKSVMFFYNLTNDTKSLCKSWDNTTAEYTKF